MASDFPTGTGIRGDLGAINSRYQKKEGTKIDKFEFTAWATRYAGGHVKQELYNVWADNSGETIDWFGDRLKENGIEMMNEVGDKNDPARYVGYATGHSGQKVGANEGQKFNSFLYKYAISKGARFDYSMKMVKLEKKDGRVTGCIAQNGDGKYVRYIAKKGTVVATGGYARNYKMMEALQPWNLRVVSRTGAMPGALGDGIKACLWVGAKMDETHCAMKFDRAAIRPNQKAGLETLKSGDNAWFWMGSQPWLKVNSFGERFINESGTYENPLHADEYNKDHAHYTIFDSNWPEYAKQFKMHGCSRLWPFANGAEPNIPWFVVKDKMLPGLIKSGFVQQADTIEELAKKLGLPVEAVKKTVEKNNENWKNGVDPEFGKEKHRLSPVNKPPYYGAKNSGWLLCTLDGIVINKADGDNLERAKLAATQFRNALHLFPAPESGWTPQVLTYSGFYNIGVKEIWDMIYEYIDFVKTNGYFEYRRNEQSKYWMYETINEQLRDSFYHNPKIEAMLLEKEQQVLQGNLTSFIAAKSLLDTYFADLKRDD